MRYVIYGAGAIGGVVGGRLFEQGHDVTLIARGDHLAAIQERGLTLESPKGTVTLKVPAVGHPSELAPRPEDVGILSMKAHATEEARRGPRSAGGRRSAVGRARARGVCWRRGSWRGRHTRYPGRVETSMTGT